MYSPAVYSVWPEHAEKQAQLDAVPCVVCGEHEGDDNIVICDGCNRCFHMRCLLPPRSTVPSGDWFCPACDPYFGERGGSKLAELRDVKTPFSYHSWDPYVDEQLLTYIRSGHDLETLSILSPRTALEIRRRGSYGTPYA